MDFKIQQKYEKITFFECFLSQKNPQKLFNFPQNSHILNYIFFQMNKDEKKKDTKKEKIPHNDKYYKIKADFSYLKQYNYRITKEIGRGGYGVVYKAVDLMNPENLCAIKINFNTVSRELIYAEMAFLILVKNRPNLPKLVNLFVYHDITHIVIEYFKFKPFITFFNTFNLQEIKHYMYELLLGLKNLKDLGIYHRDIKPGNFLYNPETKKGMIIDFGLAEIDPKFQASFQQKVKKLKQENHPDFRQKDEQLKIYKRLSQCLKIIGKNKIGTQTYMPLQSILHHTQQSYQSDMWPVGVILFQFIARKYNIFNNVRMVNKPSNVKNHYYIHYIIELATFFGEEVVQQCKNLGYELKLPRQVQKLDFRNIANIQGYDDDTDDILNRLLALNPEKRISVQEAMRHKFFDSVRDQH